MEVNGKNAGAGGIDAPEPSRCIRLIMLHSIFSHHTKSKAYEGLHMTNFPWNFLFGPEPF